MTRKEAITNIYNAYDDSISGYCYTEKESLDKFAECEESLRTLGVTEEELSLRRLRSDEADLD